MGFFPCFVVSSCRELSLDFYYLFSMGKYFSLSLQVDLSLGFSRFSFFLFQGIFFVNSSLVHFRHKFFPRENWEHQQIGRWNSC